MNKVKPYSDKDYEEAKKLGYDLDNWSDYVEWAELGEGQENYDELD